MEFNLYKGFHVQQLIMDNDFDGTGMKKQSLVALKSQGLQAVKGI
jgi:hypothetical protein